LPNVALGLTFSPDGRYIAATLGGRNGLRIFDRDKDWAAAFRDDQYGGNSFGAEFSPDGWLVTTSYDGLIRRYAYEATSDRPNYHRVGEPLKAPSGDRPRGVAFCRGGTRVAVGYDDAAAVDILDGATLKHLGGHRPADARANPAGGFDQVAWSDDCQALLAVGAVHYPQDRRLLFAWDGVGLGGERRMTYCSPNTGMGLNICRTTESLLPQTRLASASWRPTGSRFGPSHRLS
jgi:WD40 repeat protein